LQRILSGGLKRTAALWPSIELGYQWVWQAARVLDNTPGHDVLEVRRAYRALLREMKQRQAELGALAGAVTQFRKVTKSYWPGLFRCYEQANLPRTNNGLEQCFGSLRYQERRASGRKVAAPGLVVRGRVRLVAAVSQRGRPLSAAELRPADLARWRQLRAELAGRQEGRRRQLRFRRDPQAYLSQLEAQLLQASLPS
jgi:hypothetical protein